MSIPDSAQSKLNRTKYHLRNLKEARAEFMASDPYNARRILVDPDINFRSGTHKIVWEKYTPIPDHFALIFGDTIRNSNWLTLVSFGPLSYLSHEGPVSLDHLFSFGRGCFR